MAGQKVAGRLGIKYKKKKSEGWICPACQKEGVVRIKVGASLEKILERMLAQHRLKNRNCSNCHVELKNRALGLFLELF